MMQTLHQALDWEPQPTLDTFLKVMCLLGKQKRDEQEHEDIAEPPSDTQSQSTQPHPRT